MGEHRLISDGRRSWDGKPQQLRRIVCACGYAVSHSDDTAAAIMVAHIADAKQEDRTDPLSSEREG